MGLVAAGPSERTAVKGAGRLGWRDRNSWGMLTQGDTQVGMKKESINMRGGHTPPGPHRLTDTDTETIPEREREREGHSNPHMSKAIRWSMCDELHHWKSELDRDTKTHTNKVTHADTDADTGTDRQTYRQTDRQTGRQADR